MKKGKKFFGKKKNTFKSATKKKKAAEDRIVNKKALFNRYKNAQKVEEELEKKRKLEEKLQQQIQYSESEEEEDAYDQLLSCFSSKKRTPVAESEEDSSSASDMDDDDEAMETTEGKHDDGNNIDEEDEGSASDDDSGEDEIQIDNEEVDEPDMVDDPFSKHLQYDLGDELLVSLTNTPPTMETTTKIWPVLGHLSIVIPKPIETLSKKVKPKVSILEESTYASMGTVPTLVNKIDFEQLHIKSQIQGNIVSANKTNLIKRDLELTEVFTPLQKELFCILNNYQDLYYPERSFSNADEIRYTYCLHVVNHMLKTRTKILHHNAKLSKKSDLSDEYRDQGLVRPKVLIMVPFKDAAYRVVKTLIEILVPKEAGEVVNKKRFEEDFTGGELIMPRKNPKPEDYELMFSGNTEDTFRLGMSVTKKTLKLYTDFYSSDIIVTSPLGLRMIVGAEGEEDPLPEIKSVMNKKCHNYAGRILVENPTDIGSIQQVLVQVPQVFHRFTAANPLESVEARFQYFIKEILPKQRDTLMSHTLIYVPSYFDYVQIRNYFKKEDIGFVQICEYSKDAKIARARDMFFHTEAHFLLYSERVHFFRRFRIKGIRHIIFYQPPTYPHFFSEMCNLMQEVNQNKFGGSECNMTVSVLYCQYDLPRLAAVLGAARLARVMRSDNSVHMFVTGEK
ncbi:hypothetical protein HF086_014108 [Spodoptera exigua]|uniref:Digestive organ expansion factor n=1 Tax=Spodoptera exigua TaxID=7107 RepID=A0A922SJD1_SPOEX|nr:hypothetical protein HF086_014108 [Spodoptera exigua]